MEKVVIKISGELLLSTDSLNEVINQIKELSSKYQISLVIGAGNIFRGNRQGKLLGVNATTGDNAGMLATIINGLTLQDLLEKKGIKTKLLSALHAPGIADYISQEKINCSIEKKKVLIFVGGTGNPFFTTDTNAILRALQTDSKLVLKGTKVNGVFEKDPQKNEGAEILKEINFDDFLKKDLQVMDLTAITLAKKYGVKIKVFNIFEKDAIVKALKDNSFGSTITNKE